MSEIKVNSIKGVGASAAAITVNNSDGTCTANITNNLSNRNLIQNGSFIVHQRGGTTTTSSFLLDRWYVSSFGGTATFSQGTETSGIVYEKGLVNYHRITNTANSTGSGAYRYVRQAIEAQNLLKSGWNYKNANAKITLSFYVRSSVAQNFYGYLRLSDSPDSRYAFETGSLSADTWTKVTKVIPGYTSANIDNEPAKKKFLTFPDYQIEERFADKIPEQLKENVIGAVCELSIKLEQHGLLLESINSNGDYLTKAVYSVPSSTDSRVIIAINNKGQKDNWSVSSIRIEQSASDHHDAINQEIESLFAAEQESSGTATSEFPDDFRKPIYQNWNSVLNNVGFQLSLTESHKNQDVFSISGGNNESAKIRVWYGNDGFFRKIVVLQKSKIELGENLKKWLLNGNKA